MIINKSYSVIPHNESNLITEAFGIDGGYENKICSLEIPTDFDILYITGESGSGKSTILNEICKTYKQIEIPYEKPLFLWLGDSEENKVKAIEYLTLVGISDALMFVNYYDKLSDSQKARCRIMLELLSDNEIVCIDEFLSTLDRKTAKSVAYCIQKFARKLKRKCIFVTAHNDLGDYLKPSYTIIGKSFPSRFEIVKNNYNNNNTILQDVKFFYGDKTHYRNLPLGELHYKGKYTGGTKEFLFATYDDEIIGCLVSTYRMNDGGRRISRVVIHPSYRGVGVGVSIVSKYLEDYTNVDVIAAMALYNPIFEKAGMVRTNDSIVKSPTGLKKMLKENKFDLSMWHSKSYCFSFCESHEIRILLSLFSKSAGHLVCPGGKYLDTEDIANKIINEHETAARVLFGLRDRKMAKYIQS